MRSESPIEPARPIESRDLPSTQDAMLSWVRDIAPYGIFATDANLVIRDWNEWLAAHSGRSAAEVVGRPLLEVFPDLAKRRLHEHFARALRGEIAVLSTALHQYLLPFPNPVREYNVAHMLQTARIAPLPADDRIVGTITIIEDVTQRECQAAILRRQQEYDRLLSDSLALLLRAEDPLATMTEIFPRIAAPLQLDVYFHFVSTPPGQELQLQAAGGVAPEVRRMLATLAVGTTLWGQVAVGRTPLVVEHVQQSESKLAGIAQQLGLRSYAGFPLLIGDRVLGTLSFGSYVRDTVAPGEIEFLGKVSQYLAIAMDRAQRETALEEAQARLSAHADELEKKVVERTARLHETITQLESFSYTVAHDLRAPIRSLTSFADLLLSDYGNVIPTEAQDLLRRLQRASRRLDALTRDLLRFSRVIREDVKLAPVDLDEVIHDMVSETPSLQENTVTVVHPLGSVLAQRTLLQQCVSNLFDNALKFAAPGTSVRITVRTELRPGPAEPREVPEFAPLIPATMADTGVVVGPRVRLWIEDNGVGIPPEAHVKIFGIFERLPNARNVEGTGIGLAIVARAMQQMGGACGLESNSGQGARFWLEFRPPEIAPPAE